MVALVDSVVKRLLRTAVVEGVADIGPSFRRVDLRVDGRVSFSPGCKVQAWMGGASFRTFTPFAWDGDTVSLLVFRAGHTGHDGPATPWVDGLTVGSTIDLLGPKKSLVLSDLSAPPVVVGDETSIAVATTTPAEAVLLEVTSRTAVEPVLAAVGIDPAVTLVERQPDDAHHEALAANVVEALRAVPAAPLVITGKAQTIRAVRGAVKDAGLSPAARVKAYWDPNRSGLD